MTRIVLSVQVVNALNLVDNPTNQAILACIDESMREIAAAHAEVGLEGISDPKIEELLFLRRVLVALAAAEVDAAGVQAPEEAAELAEHVGRLGRALAPYLVAQRAQRVVRQLATLANRR